MSAPQSTNRWLPDSELIGLRLNRSKTVQCSRPPDKQCMCTGGPVIQRQICHRHHADVWCWVLGVSRCLSSWCRWLSWCQMSDVSGFLMPDVWCQHFFFLMGVKCRIPGEPVHIRPRQMLRTRGLSPMQYYTWVLSWFAVHSLTDQVVGHMTMLCIVCRANTNVWIVSLERGRHKTGITWSEMLMWTNIISVP